jgi:hydroxyacylglutathione hydrolase
MKLRAASATPASCRPGRHSKTMALILKQFYLGCLAHASYLVADDRTGEAAVVDPQRDIDHYLQEAERLGLAIRHVLLTHFHADFIAGDRELQQETGAQIHLGAAADPEFAHHKLADGDDLRLGDARIRALATPGHTPESTSYLVFDDSVDAEHPHAVLTGDTLFIGDVGRPDLLGAVGHTADQLASMLYDSLHDKLLQLPDETLVYPAHGAGSMCGKNLSSETVSTIGKQRAFNYALQQMPREQFVAMLTDGQPKAPAYFLHDALLNRRERPTIDKVLADGMRRLTLPEAVAAAADGAQLIDVRRDFDVAEGTVQGALHVSLEGSFATWAGTLLDLEGPIVVLTDPDRAREAVTRLARVGFERVVGHVDDTALALQGNESLRQRTPQIDVSELPALLAGDSPPLVLDVRTPGEWDSSHISGALHIPLGELRERIGEVPTDRPVHVICRTSNRSASAVSLLRSHGIDRVTHVLGGMSRWPQGSGQDTPTCDAGR